MVSFSYSLTDVTNDVLITQQLLRKGVRTPEQAQKIIEYFQKVHEAIQPQSFMEYTFRIRIMDYKDSADVVLQEYKAAPPYLHPLDSLDFLYHRQDRSTILTFTPEQTPRYLTKVMHLTPRRKWVVRHRVYAPGEAAEGRQHVDMVVLHDRIVTHTLWLHRHPLGIWTHGMHKANPVKTDMHLFIPESAPPLTRQEHELMRHLIEPLPTPLAFIVMRDLMGHVLVKDDTFVAEEMMQEILDDLQKHADDAKTEEMTATLASLHDSVELSYLNVLREVEELAEEEYAYLEDTAPAPAPATTTTTNTTNTTNTTVKISIPGFPPMTSQTLTTTLTNSDKGVAPTVPAAGSVAHASKPTKAKKTTAKSSKAKKTAVVEEKPQVEVREI